MPYILNCRQLLLMCTVKYKKYIRGQSVQKGTQIYTSGSNRRLIISQQLIQQGEESVQFKTNISWKLSHILQRDKISYRN
jgi:hypothetical protein